jgi:hypothetical protein
MVSFDSVELITTTGIYDNRGSSLIKARTSNPLISGIIRSSKTRSKSFSSF